MTDRRVYTHEELFQIVRARWERRIKNVPAELAFAVIHHESGWNPYARSPTTAADEKYGGAWGLCQILPKTAAEYGFVGAPEQLWDPMVNANFMTELWYRNILILGTSNKTALVAAHNCGAGAVSKRRIPESTRTQYVPAVMKLYCEIYEPLITPAVSGGLAPSPSLPTELA
jgi:soluble lytic murein transglycosylase-like protein